MIKKPDLGGLGKKFDLQGIVNNVKSMISPDGQTPVAADSDELGQKITELSMVLQDAEKSYQEMAKQMSSANRLLNEVFAGLEAERGVSASAEEAAQSSEETSTEAEVAPESAPEAEGKDSAA